MKKILLLFFITLGILNVAQSTTTCRVCTVPTGYTFDDGSGNSTVYYGGQASRLGAAEDIYTH